MRFSLEDLQSIVEQSAYLQERMEQAFVPAGEGDKMSASRLEQWRQSAALGNDELFQKRLAWEGLTPDGARALLGAVKLPHRGVLPEWTGTLCAQIQFAGEFAGEPLESRRAIFSFLSKEEPLGFEDLFAPFVAKASENVRRHAGSSLRLLSGAAYVALERALLKSLCGISAETLNVEFDIFRSGKKMGNASGGAWFGQFPGEAPAVDIYASYIGWMLGGGLIALFREYAVLARLVGTISDLWIRNTIEFLDRLEADLPQLQQCLCPDQDLGPVAALRPGISDRHQGGRSSCWIQFASGATVIYKPKDLTAEELYYQLLDWLNGRGLSLPFATFQVLNRGAYGWVEEVRHLPCRSEEEVRRYYGRAGMLLCLIYVLEGTDCHHENLIACGEHPVLIDMESLLQHRVRMYSDSGSGESAVAMANQVFFWDSVFRTALLPRWEFGISGQSYDISGLGGIEGQATSFRRPVWTKVNTDQMRLESQIVTTAPHHSVVRLEGRRMAAADYVEEILDGFNEIYGFFAAHRREMVEGPLARMTHLPVRFIYRHTKIYTVLLNRLFLPQHLRNGVDAGLVFEVLARPLLHGGSPPEFTALLHSEQRALLQGDVPCFRANAGSDGLFLDSGDSIAQFFAQPSFEQLRQRFDQLSETDCQRQTGYIRSSFYTSRQTPEGSSARGMMVVQPGELGPDLYGQFETEAFKIAREIRKAAITASDGTASWITLAYYAEAQRWQLQPMASRLYDGITGVALFLAAMTQLEGGGEFRELALAALRATQAGFDSPIFERHLLDSGIGAGLGAASVVYAFARCSLFLHDESLLEDAQRAANMISFDHIGNDKHLDLLRGAAGAILALLLLYRITRRPSLLEQAVACGRRLLETRVKGESEWRSWPTMEGKLITGFSHGAAGIAYALLQLYGATGEDVFREAAREARCFEASVFDPRTNNWPDFRYPSTQNGFKFQCSWCHGAPGIALGRLGGLELSDDDDVRSDIDRALRTTMEHAAGDPDHLCCGNMGRAETLLVASQKLGEDVFEKQAVNLAEAVLARARHRDQYSLGWDQGPYLASFHQGASGIGYQFLRLAHPDRFPSVLLWE